MNLKQLTNEDLIVKVRALRASERRLDRLIIELINEVEARRLHLELGFSSVIEWLIRDIGYSESAAYRRAMSARALRSLPESLVKIETGEHNLSTLSKAQSGIQAEERRLGKRISKDQRIQVLRQLENKSQREAEKVLSRNFPGLVKSGLQEVKLSEETIKNLERVRELRSHQNPGATLSEIVAALALEYLKANDPLRREIAQKKTQSATAGCRARESHSVRKNRSRPCLLNTRSCLPRSANPLRPLKKILFADVWVIRVSTHQQQELAAHRGFLRKWITKLR